MRYILVAVFLQLASLSLRAQTLYNLFLSTPGLADQTQKAQMIQNHKLRKTTVDQNTPYRLDIVDERNGFLTVTGAFEGTWEMCYWNLDTKSKLVATYSQSCGPVCEGAIKFYVLANKKVIEKPNNEIIPGFETIYQEFFVKYSDDVRQKLDERDVVVTLLFEIPRHGKDIIAYLRAEGDKDQYAEFFKGDRMPLKWDNGKFVKERIYWHQEF